MNVTPWVQRLIIVNIIVFFVQLTVRGATGMLAFVPVLALARPWTMITYMFAHDPTGFAHIFFNMLALYFFGPRVEQRLGSGRFFALYILSGISGAILSFALAPRYPIVGASGALFGVMMAFARFWPRDLIYFWGIFPIQARWLVIIYTAYSLWSGLRGSPSGVADFAHLGGYVGGMLYLLYLERASGARKFRSVATAPPPAKDAMLTNWRNVNRAGVHEVNKEEVDRILDKISATGIASLTPQERTFLSNFVPPDDRKPG
jgi:membrane associated rhomboid family serine protease